MFVCSFDKRMVVRVKVIIHFVWPWTIIVRFGSIKNLQSEGQCVGQNNLHFIKSCYRLCGGNYAGMRRQLTYKKINYNIFEFEYV